MATKKRARRKTARKSTRRRTSTRKRTAPSAAARASAELFDAVSADYVTDARGTSRDNAGRHNGEGVTTGD